MDDLLLTGGRVLDAASGLDGYLDVSVSGDRITAIGQNLPTARSVLDLSGKLVTPGLIDMHAHVATGAYNHALDPDLAGVHAGVTTVVDAGSTGAATFDVLPRHVLPQSHTRVIPFLNLAQTGLSTRPDIAGPDNISVDETLAVLAAHDGLIAGVKIRMVKPAMDVYGAELVRIARSVADQAGVRLMMHIGDQAPDARRDTLSEVVPLLAPGDIVTHLFTPHGGGILDPNGRVYPELIEARDRGVLLDTAHGRRNMSFELARRAMDQGVLPHTISTDLTIQGRREVVHSLTDVMTRFLHLGFDLPQVLAMVTTNAAAALGRGDDLGAIEIGRPADLSILDLREGTWTVADATGENLLVRQAVVPIGVVKGGVVHMADWGPRPWGWEPDRV